MKTSALFACLALFIPLEMLIAGTTKEYENQYLQAELALAKKNALYTVFDLAGGKILIKAAGMTLREIPVQDIGIWGNGLKPGAYLVIEKSAFKEPERFQIDPTRIDEESPPSTDIDALERDDMPTRYTLIFEDGVFVSVTGSPASMDERMISMSLDALEYLSRPLVILWKKINGENYTVIDLEVDSVDSQSLYWTITEKSAGLFLLPED
ncbi:MAG: hypothetical protein A2V90_04160 [Gammaproteobacteria bacterium RBG_16_57_12]|nr:MAG: hypothetical protein A2V90_04160 [Gammaproteobacteria bacterium RBG_16_57_12]